MDPSLSLSSDHDPHHTQQQFYPFPPFAVHTPFGAPYSVTNPAVFGATSAVATATNNHHVAEAPTNTHHLPFNLPPYVDMIYMAIAGLNEPEGSSKQAISRFIERVYSGLPPAHDALVSYHLTCLKDSGVLVMVQDLYKFPTVPASSSALQPSRTDVISTITDQDHNLSDSIALPQKRGRSRPPKAKGEAQILGAQPKASEHSVVQSNIDARLDPAPNQPNSDPVGDSETQAGKQRPGSPKTNGQQLAPQIAPVSNFVKKRGRPPGVRGPGRPRKPKSVTAPAMVFPYAVNGARRRGRPRRAESLALVPAVAEGEAVVSPGKRRGRPPKTNGMVDKPMKPLSRTGRPVGRPRKNATPNNTAYEELRRKFDFFQDTVKQALGVLKAEMDSESQVAVSAIQELEGLIATDNAAAVEVQMQSQTEAEAQRSAEAMQEALF